MRAACSFPNTVRPGPITEEALGEVAPTGELRVSEEITAPGQAASHYAPEKRVYLLDIKDTADLITDIQNNTLPAVSVGKPDGLLDGHPAGLVFGT